jgi:8-oxo-dGTP diphosphatase
MPPPYCYDYPRPAVTVDVAVFSLDGPTLKVLLIRRKDAPFAGRKALPGGFLDVDEPFEAAARRELKEETGLELTVPLEFLAVYGDPGRDPRGWTISLTYVARVSWPPPPTAGGDDAEEAVWLDARAVKGLAFDHDRILKDAVGRVSGSL